MTQYSRNAWAEGSLNDAGEPSRIYYSASIVSTNAVDSGSPTLQPQITFDETLNTPLIKETKNYLMSVQRFTLNGAPLQLPVFIPSVRLGQSDPSWTNYSLTLEFTVTTDVSGVGVRTGTFFAQRWVKWEPQCVNETVANPPIEFQDMQSSQWYFAFTYQHMLNLVNKAFAGAMSDAQTVFGMVPTLSIQKQFNEWYAAFPGSTGPPPTLATLPPTITYDGPTNLFTLNTHSYGYGGVNRQSSGLFTDESGSIFANANMAGLFDGLPNKYLGTDSDLYLGKDVEWIVDPAQHMFQNILTFLSPPAPADVSGTKWWYTRQETPSTSQLFSPIESIVFCSNMLPVMFESNSPSILLGQGNGGINTTSVAAWSPIVTDSSIAFTNGQEARSFFYYSPSGVNRYSVMTGGELRQIQLSVWWKLRLTGALLPMVLTPLSSVSIKILFQRADTA